MICDIVNSIINFLVSFSNMIGLDMLFIIALGVEVVFVLFFLIKSAFSYEASLNRALDRLNYWIFSKKVVTEENIKELNMLFKTRAPKRLCYYWQQYILFRESAPSTYLSTENLVDKPLKTSSYNSNIKNLTLFTCLWAFVVSMFIILVTNSETALLGKSTAMALLVPLMIALIGVLFIVYLRARKNAVLNSLYQNVSTFGRFMDNACIDLPSYIDYQILFTPQEIEKGQPVLREFLDYKARKEKEEFQKAKEDDVYVEKYDFSETGIDGSIVLDRAMKESELFLKKKEKILVKISQLEAELDSRRKNFDNTQKDYQTKIQASKENVNRLRQMQEETTNRIESNYYRKQQTQEIGKQEQYEQEFEGLRAKYLLEKKEGEEEINKLNNELAQNKADVENAMKGEYSTFFNKFCLSAEKVVNKVFADKLKSLKEENEKNKQYITELEIKLKNVPQGEYDGAEQSEQTLDEGQYDEYGNYVYANGSYYDVEGNFHDTNGDVYTQDGQLISQAQPTEEQAEPVDLEKMDAFDFMTDVSQKDAIYDVAENIIKDVDSDNEINLVEREKDVEPDTLEDFNFEDETEEVGVPVQPVEESVEEDLQTEEIVEEKPKKKAGRPRKLVEETVEQPKKKVGRPRKVVETPAEPVEKRKAGRPRKIVTEEPKPAAKRGRPRKLVEESVVPQEKRKAGRPKKIVKDEPVATEKRGRGRPKKNIEGINEINKKLDAEEKKMSKMKSSIDKELENAVSEINNNVDDKRKKREELLKQIDALQKEAQQVIANNEPESKIIEVNERLGKLLDEISKLDN